MGNFLIVSNVEQLEEYWNLAKEYNVAFEINDFYEPSILEDANRIDEIVDSYLEYGIPQGSTMHGAFLDVTLFSRDIQIQEISRKRMRQSMEIAGRLGVKGVVFHTNFNPMLEGESYNRRVIECTTQYLTELLLQYHNIEIYLENMFERTPEILQKISEKLCIYDNYGVCFDYAHASVYGTKMKRWVESLARYIKHIHINDNDLRNDLHLAVGDGLMNWKHFERYYNIYFSKCSVLIETNSIENQRKSIDYLIHEIGIFGKEPKKRSSISNLSEEGLLEQIFYYMNKIMDETDFKKALYTLTELGKTLAGSDRASFWYWDKRNKKYWTLAAWGREKISIPEGTGIVGAAIQEQQAILIHEPYSDQRFNPDVDKESGYVTKSILCMPITNEKGDVIGAFQAINKLDVNGEDCKFEEHDVRHLAMVAVFCGKTLESHILQREAQNDPLTGLKNRRGFYEYYSQKVDNRLSDMPMSIVICDIDFFKVVNDTYGHNAGDAVLIHVADILQGNLCGEDEVVRWGGEEFVFLLANKDLEQAVIFAENVRRQVEASVCEYADFQIKITMSFGVADLNREQSSDVNVKAADDMLYLAKKSGRNCVMFDGEKGECL